MIVRERVGGGPRFHVVVFGDRVRTFRRRCDATRYERRRGGVAEGRSTAASADRVSITLVGETWGRRS